MYKRQTNIDKLLKENPNLKIEDIPTEMVTASGSGLDLSLIHIFVKKAQLLLSKIYILFYHFFTFHIDRHNAGVNPFNFTLILLLL